MGVLLGKGRDSLDSWGGSIVFEMISIYCLRNERAIRSIDPIGRGERPEDSRDLDR